MPCGACVNHGKEPANELSAETGLSAKNQEYQPVDALLQDNERSNNSQEDWESETDRDVKLARPLQYSSDNNSQNEGHRRKAKSSRKSIPRLIIPGLKFTCL